MDQAEQATTRITEAADRLGDIEWRADTSGAISNLDRAVSSAAIDSASALAQKVAGGLGAAGASVQSFATSPSAGGTVPVLPPGTGTA